jgi:hypothetical protein
MLCLCLPDRHARLIDASPIGEYRAQIAVNRLIHMGPWLPGRRMTRGWLLADALAKFFQF